MIAFDEKRAKHPTTKKMMEIDHKYGGKPKADQLVREGHYPKISEMIDMIEDISKQFVSYEHFLECSKVQNLRDLKAIEDILSGKKDPHEIERGS